MPKTEKEKEDRRNNRENRNRARRENYAQTRLPGFPTLRRWSDSEIRAIMDPKKPLDRVLARELNRSVQAIQIKRSRQPNITKRRIGVAERPMFWSEKPRRMI